MGALTAFEQLFALRGAHTGDLTAFEQLFALHGAHMGTLTAPPTKKPP